MNLVRSSLLVLAFLVAAAGYEAAEAEKADAPKKRPRGHFTIGKETTYVKGPLDKEGYVDYAAALNERLRQGVTPANNANVLFWKAMGPHPERATMPSEFFKWMGIQAPPERGAYFIDLNRYLKEQWGIGPGKRANEIADQFYRSYQRPWTAKKYPHVAGWLEANQKPLAMVILATKRSHYFSPLVPAGTKKGQSGLYSALLPGVQKCREFAFALAARAMLHVSEGASDDAWQDLMACHRLGRLLAHGGTLVEGLVGLAINSIAAGAELAFLDCAKLRAKQIEPCLRDLERLPPLPPMADKVNLCERFSFLDTVLMIDRQGFGYLETLSGGRSSGPKPEDRALEIIDWDLAMRKANRWYDRVVVAMGESDRSSRKKKLDQIDADLKALRKKNGNRKTFLERIQRGKPVPRIVSEGIGDVLVALMVPALSKVQHAADRVQQIQANLTVAFALAWYQREHGRYPRKLAVLAPRYLKKIPHDLFSGKALLYRPSEIGYLLYSVGPNGKDDGGRTAHDEEPGDDLSIRMPLPEGRPN